MQNSTQTLRSKENPRVAVATGADRAEAARNALELARADILGAVRGRTLIKPNFLSSTNQLASTHADTVEALLSFLLDTGIPSDRLVLGEGGSRSTMQAVENFGYRRLVDDMHIGLVDINRSQFSRSFGIITSAGGRQTADYSDMAAGADTVISVPVAKTHDCAAVTLSLKNMMGCLRRVHRPRMHGIVIPDPAARAGEMVWNTIEPYSAVMKSFSGVVFLASGALRKMNALVHRGKSRNLLRNVGAMAENLARMAEVLLPDIALIDAFEAMEGQGPGGGTKVDMRVCIAGTDPIACDAVVAHLMGFDPLSVGYLALCHERGLGIAALEDIHILGGNPADFRRSFARHRNNDYHMRWREAFT